MDEAVQTVKPALQAFYKSLNDEQKARFNELGPNIGDRSPRQQEASAKGCGDPKYVPCTTRHCVEHDERPTRSPCRAAAATKVCDRQCGGNVSHR